VSHARPLWEVLSEAAEVTGLPVPAVDAIDKFRKLIEDYRRRLEGERPSEVVADLIHTIRYQDEINRQYKEPADQLARWSSVEEVVNALAGYQQRAKTPTLAGFLDDVALAGRDEQDDKESKLARNAIVLMTLHSAKGLEYPQVYLVGMEEGLLPHSRSVAAEGSAIDEERRLCYVGVTRAKDKLTLTLSLSRNKWGKPRDTTPSRFLFELLGKADNPESLRRKKLRPA